MRRLGYSSPSAFFNFIKKAGVPRIRLNARKVVFDPVALESWLRKRAIGTHAAPILGDALPTGLRGDEEGQA